MFQWIKIRRADLEEAGKHRSVTCLSVRSGVAITMKRSLNLALEPLVSVNVALNVSPVRTLFDGRDTVSDSCTGLQCKAN